MTLEYRLPFTSMARLLSVLWLALAAAIAHVNATNLRNRTFTNPILPGWNSDPSCTFVKDWNDTLFCTTSSFLTFPGIPVFASKDFTSWKLASNALTREEQLPELARNGLQHEGIWASTIRYREGVFYIITAYVSWIDGWGPKVLLFKTTDPYDDSAWSDPVRIDNPGNDIDPDLFWDDDGTAYMSVAAGIYISEVDLDTGHATEPVRVWNGTGDRNPEGPHIYKKDEYYYLLIGEGGTETNHSVTIARSRHAQGPYEGYEGNPILTAKDTDEWFQTVGHADIFQDASDNWWGVALATRSGPAWEVYPMGRESVLFAVTWDEGGWPVLDMVHGKMTGPLPRINRDIPGDGPWADGRDVVDFTPGTPLPRNFLHWRPPKEDLFAVSPRGHPNTLRISPSRTNLTGDDAYDPTTEGLGFIARKQTSSIFQYSVDVSFQPTDVDEEAGITVFLTQFQHIDLGTVNMPNDSADGKPEPKLRLRVESSGKPDVGVLDQVVEPIPRSWLRGPIRLSVTSTPEDEYVFTASPAGRIGETRVIGKASAEIVSGGSGPFTGNFDTWILQLRECTDQCVYRYHRRSVCHQERWARFYACVL